MHFEDPQIDTCQCGDLKIKIKSPSLVEAAKRSAVAEIMINKRRAKKCHTALQDTTKVIQGRGYCSNCLWLHAEFAVTGGFCPRTFLLKSTKC